MENEQSRAEFERDLAKSDFTEAVSMETGPHDTYLDDRLYYMFFGWKLHSAQKAQPVQQSDDWQKLAAIFNEKSEAGYRFDTIFAMSLIRSVDAQQELDALDALTKLVEGLHRTTWSSWQSTAHFDEAMAKAEKVIAAQGESNE